MDVQVWLLFLSAYALITYSPGPNVLLVVNHAGKYGFSKITPALLGNLFCQLLIIIGVWLGVGALLQIDSLAYSLLKYAGAGYLIFLGVKALRHAFSRKNLIKEAPFHEERRAVPTFLYRFREAFFVSALNPKTVIFLGAFLPQFVEVSYPLFLQFLIMYLTIAVVVVSVHSVYAALIVQLKRRLPGGLTAKVGQGASGVLYIVFGSFLGLSRS